MSRTLFVLILWFLHVTAFSSGSVLITRSDFQNEERSVCFDTLWRFMPGDNAAWADQEFDDSGWEGGADSRLIKGHLPGGWNGQGWFRTRIKPSDDIVGVPLGLVFGQICAAEVYIDGEKIVGHGVFGTSAADQECQATFGEVDVLPVTFADTSSMTVAVRYSNFRYRDFLKNISPSGFQMHVAEYRNARNRFDRWMKTQTEVRMFFTGIPVAFTILHFLFFVYYPRQKANLYYAIFTAGTAALTWSILGAWMNAEIGAYFLALWIFKISLLVIFMSGLQFLYAIFYEKAPPWHWLFLCAAVILALLSWYVGVDLIYGAGFFFLLEESRVIALAFIKRKKGAVIILIGNTICVLACTYQMLMGFGVAPQLPGFFMHMYLFGFTGLMICMSVYLARNFAQTNNALIEVSARQEKTIRQLESEIKVRKQAEALNRQHQEKLIQADKMASVGILVSGVAHEINNPNNYMLLNSNNLSDVWRELKPVLDRVAEEKGDFMVAGLPYSDLKDEVGNLISGIAEGSGRIKTIVENLKDFARQDPGNMNELVDINSVIKSSVIILSNLIKKSTDHFITEFDESLPRIKGNRQQIEQVLINLLSNSCQAMEDRSRTIRVATRWDKDEGLVRVSVVDEGKGIHSEEMKHILDPFFTTKRDTGGTGLGLSISYNIIKDHKGDLTFASEPGKGTEAMIVLPADGDRG